ncbi:N-methylation domain-containing protein [Desulfurobacterium thermolithotrophum DSM 11699]|uniref:N-methylation domain-containing protein n=1 Tax=Desulfurobacterium thermolithotrophum (strain DSM 11699 / BSA) TaxID=868864 RepID=F0S1Z1_DESTD|nr:prepilin-type N-terminal cleavage/methylation domain-containing protein [Desulfurobacterium thermolithotrophum]ADY74072.1 N-methylation domain-containing protein [Desulfurobacterium thermolithotrophum DSM 11699]
MKERKGFTLVELAIVLVIIGLLLGAVLKGQELIQNAKYKKLINDLQGLSAAVYTYYDRYKALPGDDPKAGDKWGSTYSNIINGDGNGLISGSPTSTTNTDESVQIWRHLRAAGIISGNPNESTVTRPSNPYGGRYGFSSRSFGSGTYNYIFIDNLPAEVAKRLDEEFDDGVYNTGSIQANGDYTSGYSRDVYYRL